MNRFSTSVSTKLKERKKELNLELLHFVTHQFKQLAKRNLKVPIQLYHL